jgi:hypothetical protein
MSLYTGAAYPGQNNMTAQGCLHAVITYASPEAKDIALTVLRAYNQSTKNEITKGQLITTIDSTQASVSSLESPASAQLTWTFGILKA